VLLTHFYDSLGRDKQQSRRAIERVKSREEVRGVRLTRTRLLAASAVALLAAAVVGYTTLNSVNLEDQTEITAHRGASGSAPENTLASVRRAIEEGTDWVEIDVQETRDGEVVVAHDSDLKKLGGPGTKIWDFMAEDLRQVDIGVWYGPQFAGEKVPTLQEVLQTCKGKARVNIELKFYGHNQRLEERVAEIVEAEGMQDQIVVMSLERAMVERMKALRPEWQVGLLTAVAVGDLTRVEADFLAVNLKIARRSFIDSAHKRGKRVYAWTVNDPVVMSTMIGRGVDNIITDEPALARSILEQREELNPIERLLIELGGTWSGRIQARGETTSQ